MANSLPTAAAPDRRGLAGRQFLGLAAELAPGYLICPQLSRGQGDVENAVAEGATSFAIFSSVLPRPCSRRTEVPIRRELPTPVNLMIYRRVTSNY